MVELRTVKLHKGPFDGASTIVSHDTAIHSGELYVWSGGTDRCHFTHAKALFDDFREIEEEEWKAVNDWLDGIYRRLAGDTSPIPEGPPVRRWLFNLAVACRQYGIDHDLKARRTKPQPPPFQD